MPLPRFKTKEEIVAPFESADFIEVNGEWVHKVEADLELERGKRQTLLDEKKEEERKRKEAERRADDLAREKEARDKGVPDAEIKRMQEESEARERRIRDEEVKPLADENSSLKAKLRKLTLTDRVRSLALQHGVMSDRIDDAMLLLDKRTRLGEDGETIIVLDKDGKDTAEPIAGFLSTTFKSEKAWLYEYEGRSGSGKRTSSGNEPPRSPDSNRHTAVRGNF